jgi:YHS domain-containing protein
MKSICSLLMFFLSFSLMAQSEDALRRRNFNIDNDVAIREFDPVSYFHNTPSKGDSKYFYKHKGVVYYFASEANRDEFKKSPEKFEPAYGGWDAYMVALTGERTKINPATYKIVDGKLYLFSNFNGKNTLLLWNKDEKKLKAQADKNWTKKMH